MNNEITRRVWLERELKWLSIRAKHTISGKYNVDIENYAGKGNRMHSAQEGNDYIRERILSGESFAVGRCSYSEFGIMACAISEKLFHSKIHYIWTPSYINGIKEYKTEGSYSKGVKIFYDTMVDAIETVDGVGCFPNMVMADTLLEMSSSINSKFLYHADAVSPCCIENEPWVSALKNKKVLVINPFAELIEDQYPKIDKIWPNGMMSECEILTDPSIWFYYGNDTYKDWYTAYDCLRERVLKRDFDIAILGCGFFGFPLAAEIKKAGKQAVHMGGAVQLLFGLKGKRWDNMGYYNEYWVRPGEKTKPKFADMLDGATYW